MLDILKDEYTSFDDQLFGIKDESFVFKKKVMHCQSWEWKITDLEEVKGYQFQRIEFVELD